MKNSEPDYLQKAFAEGILQLIQSGKTEKVRYVAVNHAAKWSAPEERVRAAYYAELVYRYGYAADCIGVEVTVPDRTPTDRADLVVFHDKQQTRHFGVIECKRDVISDTEFKQAIEQGFGNV
ncbi:MAG: type I restriction enzyme HsdR N-terminal domain-containing protein [Sterolibacterium sp.]|nr:type I restriction enzyme HsdR N-terminal domain-containing protein [Sterolibacterium sp.]